MALTLASALPKSGARHYYSADWQLMIETHLPFLVARTDHSIQIVENAKAYKFDGDFFGLLTDLQIPLPMHWVVMRINGLRSSFDYSYEKTTLLIPNYQVIDQLTERYRTTMAKIK